MYGALLLQPAVSVIRSETEERFQIPAPLYSKVFARILCQSSWNKWLREMEGCL